MKRIALLTAFTYILFISMSEASEKRDDVSPFSTPTKPSSSPGLSSGLVTPTLSSSPSPVKLEEERALGHWVPSSQRRNTLGEVDHTKDYLTAQRARDSKQDILVKELTDQFKSTKKVVTGERNRNIEIGKIKDSLAALEKRMDEVYKIARTADLRMDTPQARREEEQRLLARFEELQQKSDKSTQESATLAEIRNTLLPTVRTDPEQLRIDLGALKVRLNELESQRPGYYRSECELDEQRNKLIDLCAAKVETLINLGTGFTNGQAFSDKELAILLSALGIYPDKGGDRFAHAMMLPFMNVMILPSMPDAYDESEIRGVLATFKDNTGKLLEEAQKNVAFYTKDFAGLYRVLKPRLTADHRFILVARDEEYNANFAGLIQDTGLSRTNRFNTGSLFAENPVFERLVRFDDVEPAISRLIGVGADAQRNGLRVFYDAVFSTGGVSEFMSRSNTPGLDATLFDVDDTDKQLGALYHTVLNLLRIQMNVSVLQTISTNIDNALEHLTSTSSRGKYDVNFL